MKRLVSLLCCSAGLLCAAELSDVHSVYLMPMARGLDQYLANRLTADHVFKIVTDAKLADTVFSDRIGEAFEIQMDTLLPPPPPPAPPPAPKDSKDKDKDSKSRSSLPTETVNKLANPSLNSSFGRGKGTVFLIDTKSRQVVWSSYEEPKSSNGNDMDRTASQIVTRIKKDLGIKPAK